MQVQVSAVQSEGDTQKKTRILKCTREHSDKTKIEQEQLKIKKLY